MKFRVDKITGLLQNEGDVVGNALRRMDTNGKIVVAQGFGVPIGNSFPLRFLAYIVPALHLLRQLPKDSIAEFYFATQGIIRANKKSPSWRDDSEDHYNARAIQMANTIKGYVTHVHPALDSRIRVLHDCVICPNSPTENLIEQLLNVAEKIASPRVLAFAEKRGGRLALRYMVEHLLYMRDIPLDLAGSNMLVPDMMKSDSFDNLIMIGGPPEKIFFELRKSICAELGQISKKNQQFFTQVGDPPTYHIQDGEMIWGDRHNLEHDAKKMLDKTSERIKPGMGVRQAVLRDLLVLLNDAGGSDDFRWCGKTATDIVKGREPEELPREVIQRGWDVMRTLSSY